MKGEERRNKIIQIISTSNTPISGLLLSGMLNVSRQVIVQDIAILRANGYSIISTNKGYIIGVDNNFAKVYKVRHNDGEVEKELSLIVDLGGQIKDVFIYHKAYGVLRADMNIKSRRDIKQYMETIASGNSSYLNNITSGYHYHTIIAESEEILDLIKQELEEEGFLAKLRDYEPVNFWE